VVILNTNLQKSGKCHYTFRHRAIVNPGMHGNRFLRGIAALTLFGSPAIFSQTSASLTGVGYSKPAPFLVAPGQIVTLSLRGVTPLPDGSLRTADAGSLPLPGTLAGLSATLTQPGLDSALAVPMLAVHQEKDCGTSSPQCYLTTVRVQIPFELPASTTPRLGDKGVKVPDAELVLQEDGNVSRTFPLRPVSENGHVLTSCDLANDLNPDSVCSRVAYHADGRTVNLDNPAERGETISVFAYGLGQTTPAARTGDVAGAGLSTVDPVQPRMFVTLTDRFLNSSPSLPRTQSADPYNQPFAEISFAGLAPGQVGVYQINVPIPRSFLVPVACGPDANVGAIRSNGILQVTTAQGTENIPICVAK